MRTLNIIESAYRATLEEQDDTIVWLSHALHGAGADLAVMLRGNAVNYGVRGQDAAGLAFGAERQTQPPRLADDLTALIAKGVVVYVVEEDAAERGLQTANLIEGLTPVSQRRVAQLFAEYDQVWHW